MVQDENEPHKHNQVRLSSNFYSSSTVSSFSPSSSARTRSRVEQHRLRAQSRPQSLTQYQYQSRPDLLSFPSDKGCRAQPHRTKMMDGPTSSSSSPSSCTVSATTMTTGSSLSRSDSTATTTTTTTASNGMYEHEHENENDNFPLSPTARFPSPPINAHSYPRTLIPSESTPPPSVTRRNHMVEAYRMRPYEIDLLDDLPCQSCGVPAGTMHVWREGIGAKCEVCHAVVEGPKLRDSLQSVMERHNEFYEGVRRDIGRCRNEVGVLGTKINKLNAIIERYRRQPIRRPSRSLPNTPTKNSTSNNNDRNIQISTIPTTSSTPNFVKPNGSRNAAPNSTCESHTTSVPFQNEQ